MPVREAFTETVEVDVAGVWTAIPAVDVVIRETAATPIAEISFMLPKASEISDAVWNALKLMAAVRVTQTVGVTTETLTGLVVRVPRRRRGPVPVKEVRVFTDEYRATFPRFIDVWPKAGVRTDVAILQDAWTRYYPGSVAFTGVTAPGLDQAEIGSNLDSLFEFTEELARRNGRRWRFRSGVLEYWDPSSITFAVSLSEDDNILGDVPELEDELPEVANVVFVPARIRTVGFEDKQPSVEGKDHYPLQYTPLVRQIDTVDGAVYLDDPPEAWFDGVQLTAAEDGSADAGTAQAIYNPENRWVRSSQFAAAPAGREIKVIYTAEIPIIVRREHRTSIELLGAEIHHRMPPRDPRPARAEAEKIGDAWLQERALPIRPIRLEVDVFGLRPGIYAPVYLPSEGIDQLMPVMEVVRTTRTRAGQLDIQLLLNQAPFRDEEAIFDLFRRLERLEARQTARNQTIYRYLDWGEPWGWGSTFTPTTHACPFPAEDLYPEEALYPC